MKGSRGSGEGGGTEERLCWCITLYTSYILIGSAMFQFFFSLLQLLTCILWSRLTDWCTHSNQVFLPEQIFPTGKIKINKMNVKSLQTDWTSNNAITPKIVCFSSRIFHEDLGQYPAQARTSRNSTRPSTLNVFEIRGSRDRESIVGSRYIYALWMLGNLPSCCNHNQTFLVLSIQTRKFEETTIEENTLVRIEVNK